MLACHCVSILDESQKEGGEGGRVGGGSWARGHNHIFDAMFEFRVKSERS
jgi:hypothetical protein